MSLPSITFRKLRTGATHQLNLDLPTVSVGFEAETSDQLREFPRFELRSHDDAYVRELVASQDAQPVEDQLLVRFDGLLPDLKYTLRMYLDDGVSQVIFQDQPLEEIADQLRQEHLCLYQNGFTEWDLGGGAS